MMLDPATLHRQSLKYFVRMAFAEFHPNDPPLVLSWYMLAMVHAAEQTIFGDSRRLAVNVPPRYGKSITYAVALTAWLLGRDPALKILVATYNEDLARQHDRMVKQLMQSPAYRRAFPGTVIDRKNTRQLEIYTTAGGFRMAVTTGGSATGFGGDYIILDDCMKAQDASSEAERIRVRDWYRGTIGTRLNNKGEGVIVSIQQRLHEDDLTSFILEAGAIHLNLPAIATSRERIPIGPGKFHERCPGDVLSPEREDRDTLDRLRRELGPRNFDVQYQQDPTPAEGNVVRPHWFPRYDETPEREEFRKVVQSWDTAWSDDPDAAFTVCTTWGHLDSAWYLLDVFRQRVAYYDIRARIIQLRNRWQADAVLIEDAASGKALWPEFRSKGPFRPVMWSAPSESKHERLIAQTGWMQAGKIILPEEASWLEDYLHELKSAPNCRYWDQVDSTTQFLEFAMSRQGWVDRECDPVTGRPLRPLRPTHPRFR
jgi:predicted phage terminase large subunit-like protein